IDHFLGRPNRASAERPPRIGRGGSMRLGGVLHDPAVALRRLGLDGSGFSIEELAHNRWLTPGIWQVVSPRERMVLKCLARDRPTPGSAWDAHWTRGAGDPRR